MKNKILHLILFLLITYGAYSQNSFIILVQDNRYKLNLPMEYGKYKYMGRYYIDRANKGVINYDNVNEGLNRYFPNKNEEGFLSLNLENAIYIQMRDGEKNSPATKKAVNQFVDLVNYIKEKRPKLKVGVYGIPFSFNYESQKLRNDFDKLEPLLIEIDYISPSLYLAYSENQKNYSYVINHVEKNLSLFMKYASRVNKPVYPYVWYRIHPYNKKYGLEIMSKRRNYLYLKTIKDFKYNNEKVDGIIWWEPSTSTEMLQDKKITNRGFKTIEQILIEYTKDLF